MIPDNVEKIIMTKEDYDRNVEQLLLEKINAEQEIKRLNNIIKEVRKLRKKISNLYYEEGFELDTPMLLKYIDEILDKEVN